MNAGSWTERGLSLAGTPLTWAVALLAVSVTGWLGVAAWRRSGRSTAVAGLEVLRTMIVALTALLLHQPEWVERHRPEQKPKVAVLWDRSPSMQTRDVAAERVTGGDGPMISREASIRGVIAPETWRKLDANLEVVIEPLPGDQSRSVPSTRRVRSVSQNAEEPTTAAEAAQGTDLALPLIDAARRIDSLVGIVLVSDGDWNRGDPPVDAAMRLRRRGVPVFTVAAGRAEPLPDLRLGELDLPNHAAPGKPVRVPLELASTLPRDVTAEVTLRVSDGTTASKPLSIQAMGTARDHFIWQPETTGEFTVTVEVSPQPGETTGDNNRRQATVQVRHEALRVLVVESLPRWEYRYLRNALSRDPGVEVRCLLFHPGLAKVGGGSSDYLSAFPDSIEALSQYDVVFLGDVGVGEGQLSEDDCRLLRGLVERQAAGLVFIPGWQGRQASLLGTPLGELIPVQLDRSRPGGWGSPLPSPLQLTESGRRSLLTQLAQQPAENAQVWEELPGFQWHAAVTRPKVGSDVLAVHGERSNRFGRITLLVTRPFAAGKVLFMGTDGAWRWRQGVEDLYHYRFWGQVVRWMAYQRNMAKGNTMRMYYAPEQPQWGQSVSLTVHVMNDRGEPLEDGEVIARVTAPSGRTERMRLRSEGQSWGVYRGRYESSEPGRHAVTISCDQTSEKLEASFLVQGDPLERPGDPARPEVLAEVALMSGGEAVRVDEIERVIDRLAALPLPPAAVTRLPLWSHPLTVGLIVSLLALFWILRKRVGLV